MTSVLFDYPANIWFSCNRCGLCCGDTVKKKRHVLLLRSDVQKIAEYTKQPIRQFAHKIQGRQPYIFEMNKNSVDGKCIFLKDRQCSIYEHRPLICRFYPVELTSDGNGKPVFRVTSECLGVCCLDIAQVGKKLDEDYFTTLLELARVELSDASN